MLDPYGLPAEPLPGGYRRPEPPGPPRAQPDRPSPGARPESRRSLPLEETYRAAPTERQGTPAHGYRALPRPSMYQTPARGYYAPMPDRQDPRADRYRGADPQPDRYGRPGGGYRRPDPPAPPTVGERYRAQPEDRYSPAERDRQYFPAPDRPAPDRPAQRDRYSTAGPDARYSPGRRANPPVPAPGSPGNRNPRDPRDPLSGRDPGGGRGANRDRYQSGARDWLAAVARSRTQYNQPDPSAQRLPSGSPPAPGQQRAGPGAPVDDAPSRPVQDQSGRTAGFAVGFEPGADRRGGGPVDRRVDRRAARGAARGADLHAGQPVDRRLGRGVEARLEPGLEPRFDPIADDDLNGFWEDDAVPGGAPRRSRGRAGRGGRNRRPSGPRGPAGRKPRRRRRGGKIVMAIFLVCFLIAGAVGYQVLRTYVIPPDFSGQGTGSVTVQIAQGQSAREVANALATAGVVASSRAFIKAVEQDPQAQLDPGTYRLHLKMSAALALRLLLSPASRVQAVIAIPEGWRLSQIMAALGSRSGIPLSKYQAAAASPSSLGLPSYAQDHLEGFLFPATYSVQPGMTATDVLRAMVQKYNQESAQLGVAAGASRLNLTPGQVIIVASLLQKEAGRPSDFPKIARVIYNRIAAGMELNLDSTVIYALAAHGVSRTDQQLSQGDLQTNSPYNTFVHHGLPVGPICSPSAMAIQAALHPATGNWTYFVTVDPSHGVTKFTNSFAQFQQFSAELQQNLGK